jgi:error-prone DNA polymerase
VIEVAIVRPGPIQGDMVHPYLRRRRGSSRHLPERGRREVLERTLGVPIFQEQVMQAGDGRGRLHGGEADQLRRAMAAWKRNGGLAAFEDKVIDGMRARGYSASSPSDLPADPGLRRIRLPESHAASFALLAYARPGSSATYPAAFCCALLNSQPMGFYSPSQLVQDARATATPPRARTCAGTTPAWA